MDAPTGNDSVKKLIVFNVFSIFFIFGFAHYLYNLIPTKEQVRSCLTTKNYHIYLCPSSPDYVSLLQISPYVRKAIVMTEDSAFFHHQGFDWESIEKNAFESFDPYTLKKISFKRGGSTITQQLAKNLYFDNKKTIYRKVLEAFVTVQIEKSLTKNEILERYLNVIEFGKNIFGIKNASLFYFKKMPNELNIVESAFLAMILPNPIKYSTSHRKKQLTSFAKTRIKQIIDYMFQFKLINEIEYANALDQFTTFLQQQPDLENSLLHEDNSDPLNPDENINYENDPSEEEVEKEVSNFEATSERNKNKLNSINTNNQRIEAELNESNENLDQNSESNVDSFTDDESN